MRQSLSSDLFLGLRMKICCELKSKMTEIYATLELALELEVKSDKSVGSKFMHI